MTRAKDISKILTDANISGTLDVTGETTLATHLNMGDNDTIKLGGSADLSIFHDGSNSHIVDSGTGNLNISATNFNVYNAGGTEQKIGATSDGAVDLYHDNSKKFETTSTGVTVTGNIANASGNLTLDVAGDIILDADGGDVKLSDNGTVYGELTNSSSYLVIKNPIQDQDVQIKGNDGGSEITALSLDMSDAGAASFNGNVTVSGGNLFVADHITHAGDNDTEIQFETNTINILAGSRNIFQGVSNEVIINQDGADVDFRVETAGVANFFHVDAGNDQVHIKTTDTVSNTTLRVEGTVKVSNGGQPTTGNHSQFVDNLANTYNTMFHNRSSNPLNHYILEIGFKESSPDNNGAIFIDMRDQTTARAQIFSDGDIDNHDNSYSGFSDEKLKEQIKDASSQWEDVKALTIRKFKFKTDVATGDSDAHWRLGVIAQEVEKSGMGGLVTTRNDIEEKDGVNTETGTTTKSVKYSILYMKAVKALQEAMARIETLEAKVTALENA